jgi:pyridoxal phosphate enzyme (YggS family)
VDPQALSAARTAVLARIAEAAARAGRDPGGVRVVAITKTVDAERVRAAMAAGFDAFGENRVQERATKAEALAATGDAAGEWHLVGPLQSNKARKAIELFDVIQSVDSLELAQRLDRLAAEVHPGSRLRVLLQVNVDDDPAKSGFDPQELARDLPAILELRALAVEGLMTVGRQVETPDEARPTFVALRDLSKRLRTAHPGLGPELSMGMTDDYPVAVEEGATIVRIGRAIFGERPHPR